MASVKLVKACKVYDHSVTAVRDATLDIRDREFVVLVGPSGCGKSTLLRMIAGLEDVTSGDLYIGGRRMNEVPPRDRDIAMVFQNYALYPHMSVFDNMAFGLKLRKVPRGEIAARVREAAAILQIENFLDRKPRALSGGQRQRVALGRAIVRKPKVFLFDEPLSNLDAKLRVQTRIEINRLHKALRTTMIYVTHDQVEAMTMGDRIVVMRGGVIQQVGSPLECYRNPANRFVAGFIGSPSMNFVTGEVLKGRPWRFRSDGLDLPLPVPAPRGLAPGPAVLGVRPEHVRLAAKTARPRSAPVCAVDVVEPVGNETYVYVKAGPDTLCVRLGPVDPPRPGQAVALAADPARLYLFDAKDEGRLA